MQKAENGDRGTIVFTTALNVMKRFCLCMIPPKRFDIFATLTGGCSEGVDAFRFFFEEKTRPKIDKARKRRKRRIRLRLHLYRVIAGSLKCFRVELIGQT